MPFETMQQRWSWILLYPQFIPTAGAYLANGLIRITSSEHNLTHATKNTCAVGFRCHIGALPVGSNGIFVPVMSEIVEYILRTP
jgi:hypothetical protein